MHSVKKIKLCVCYSSDLLVKSPTQNITLQGLVQYLSPITLIFNMADKFRKQ